MYRQNSAPSLAERLNSRRPKRNGEVGLGGSSLHATRPRHNMVGSSSNGLARSPNNNNTRNNADDNDDNPNDDKLRQKLLEQLQCLGKHLAGNVVDFLIEEVEKKILNDYAKAAMGEESNAGMDDDEEEEESMGDSNLDILQSSDEEEEEEQEESEVVEENAFEDEDEDDEEEMKFFGRPARGGGGLGSLYGSGGRGNLQNPSSLGRGRKGGLYAGGDDSDSSLGLAVGGGGPKPSRTAAASNSRNNGGLYGGGGAGLGGNLYGGNNSLGMRGGDQKNKTKNGDVSPSMPSRGLRSGGNRQRSVSPRRNTIQGGSLQPQQQQAPKIGAKFGRRLSATALLTEEDEEDDDEDLLPSPASRFGAASAENPYRRNATLPPRLNAESPPNSPKSRTSFLSPNSSPKRSGGKLDLSRFEKGSPMASPKRSNQLLSMASLDHSDKSNDGGGTPDYRRKLAGNAKRPSRLSNSDDSLSPKRNSRNKLGSSPSPKRESPKPAVKAPGKRAQRPSLMVKQGSVRQVMSMFESKESRRAAGNRTVMPLLRESSVKHIMDSLEEDQDKNHQDGADNPNEAPSDFQTPPNMPTRTRTPPKMPSRSPNQSPKRGVQRNTSGIRMQRFLEKKSNNDRPNSGVKAFLSKKGSGSSNGSSGSIGRNKPSLARKTSGGKRGVERTASGMRRGGRPGLTRQFSFGRTKGTAKSSSFGMFARDSVTNKLSNETRKQKRIFKTQNALRKLKRATEHKSSGDSSEGSDSQLDESNYDLDNLLGSSVTIKVPLPCGVKHHCALLFVDISGFTMLSTRLKVEQLSKTINAYFQLIVEHIEAFGGDVLKFAGDAVFVEWRSTRSSLLATSPHDPHDGMYGGEGLGDEKAVITAAACAARIIDKCTDYEVMDEDGKKVATLNLHCAIGYGEVIGVHLGTIDRMEYFIIGDPIKQVATAMDLGKMGEVVASPECLKYLEGKPASQPKVILSKSNKFLNPKLMLVKPEKRKKNQGNSFGDRLDDWDVLALKSLQKLMSPYVHPVVVDNPLFRKGYGSTQDRFTAEAEIRDVFTVFIQPMVSSQVTGNVSEDSEVLETLHNIMVIVNNELRRFKGQLRQYTVDDKGIVLIANFGLRGSTFPEMVERLAMPFATNVQQILKTKLDVDTVMGATYGKAYCGVVGGIARHEYAVLGPSVNLAARLMANKANKGFLVDEEVRRKASNRGFEGLAPVKAKGYKQLVPIFEPVLQHRRSWGAQGTDFVGRTSEIKQMLKLAEDVIDAGASTPMVWVSAESGYGKSALLAHATEKVQDLCSSKSATHIILCHVCSDSDSFQPLSVVGPLCLDILAFVRRDKDESRYKKPDGFNAIAALAKPGSEHSPFQILGACRDAEIPDTYIRPICSLLLNHSWPTEVGDCERDAQISEVARYIVTLLLQSTIHLDLVVWAVDDIPHADRGSWKVLELLHQYSCNFLLLMASRPVAGTDMNVDIQFWERLQDQGENDGSFAHLELRAMTRDDLDLLVRKFASSKGWDANVDFATITKEVFVQSGGVPHLAAQILERKSSRITGKGDSGSRSPKLNGNKKNSANSLDRLTMSAAIRQPSFASLGSGSAHSGTSGMAQVGEHMMHRMDLLSHEARTHINLGAILGPAFESADVVSVMERYRGISESDREGHKQSVLESLVQAADSGILEEDLTGAGNSMSFTAQETFLGSESVTYKFTHDDWRKNILKVVLDSWKRDMYQLLAASLEARFDFKSRRPDRQIRQLFDPFKGGKKKGKNISVASELALKIGAKMADNGKGRYSVRIYQRALDYWLKDDESNGILMFEDENESKSDLLTGEDLEYVLKLNAAMGRCSLLLMDKDKSTGAFQANLDLVPDSKDLKDPASLFPSFSGRFYTNRLARKIDHEPETDFVYSFVEEAEAHKNPIHQLQALAMEAEVFGRAGECDKALEACQELRNLYNVATHSSQLIDFYGDDYCAQCIAQSASWHFQLSQNGKAREDSPGQAGRALSLCREFLPVKDSSKVKCAGSADSEDADEEEEGGIDSQQSEEEVENSFSPFRLLHKPITILMDLSSRTVEDDTAVEYANWALNSKCEFDKAFNMYTGSIGRTADSITAEICLYLATYEAAASFKSGLMSKASSIVTSSMKLTKYMPAAYKQVKGFAYDKKFRGL
eukprot:Sro368_g127930.2  (2147) ;mRNA; r:15598-22595